VKDKMNKTNDVYNWIWPRVKSALSGKVNVEHGKTLSSNDYTAEDKAKVDNISSITENEIDELFRKE